MIGKSSHKDNQVVLDDLVLFDVLMVPRTAEMAEHTSPNQDFAVRETVYGVAALDDMQRIPESETSPRTAVLQQIELNLLLSLHLAGGDCL